MKGLKRLPLPAPIALLLPLPGHAQDRVIASPQAAVRTYAQNDKDTVLATCIANAYRSDKDAAEDAGSSVSALRGWTRYNMEKSPDAVRSLADRYLARNQANPLADAGSSDCASAS